MYDKKEFDSKVLLSILMLPFFVCYAWANSLSTPSDKDSAQICKLAKAGNLIKIKVLLSTNPELKNAKGEYDRTALHEAAWSGHANVVEFLLLQGLDPNAQDKFGRSALHYATSRGHSSMVSLLLDSGSDVNAIDAKGETPIDSAMKVPNRAPLVELLYTKGAKVVPIFFAAYLGNTNKVINLLDNGANVNLSDRNGRTLLHYASESGNKELSLYLLSRGSDINIQDNRGLAPLHLAVAHRNIVKILVSKGADFHAKDQSGETPMHKAAQGGYLDVVKMLIMNKAHVDAKNILGMSPLHTAAYAGQYEVVRQLLDAGAAPNARDSLGQQTPLMNAAWKGHKHIVYLLVDQGANVLAETFQGETALHRALQGGHKDVAKLLIANGIDLNSQYGQLGMTPLSWSVIFMPEWATEFLLDSGADVNLQDGKGWTALFTAAFSGKNKTAELLISRGADVDAKNGRGPFGLGDSAVPLHAAVRKGHENMVKILLANGSSVNSRDCFGFTPLYYAIHKDIIEIVKLLKEYGAKE